MLSDPAAVARFGGHERDKPRYRWRKTVGCRSRTGARPRHSAGHGFIEDSDPEAMDADWPTFLDRWLALFDRSGRFRLDTPIACRPEDLTARDYVESDLLDLDRLSIPRQPRQTS